MITACIITRDQANYLKQCLECLSCYDMDIVVVDTGSVDDSIAVAKQYTDKVYEFEWINDFAAAKNYAISKAETDMVFVVDTDEFVDFINMEELLQQTKKSPEKVGRVKRINQYETQGESMVSEEWINRIFSKSHFHYEGSIHEQVVSESGDSFMTYQTSVVMTHAGYDLTDAKKQEKTWRNITLLEQELENFTNAHEGEDLLEADPKIQNEGAYILYQLGKSYYMRGDYQVASQYFDLGLMFDLDTRLEYVIDMVETYAYALINSGQAKKALLLEGVYEMFDKNCDFVFAMGLVYMNNKRFEEAVKEFEKAATFASSKVAGANSYLAYYNAGVIRECQGKIEEAKKYYRKCKDYDKAKERLKQCES